ncbi:MAG TPA: hypothetical protein VED45_08000, partial [Steroidobacteraceae bacterium]|nr:hypothetical protein [Steroidobacteraceae bacterium]
MSRKLRPLSRLLVCMAALGSAASAARETSVAAPPAGAPFTAEDLVMLKRVTDPQVSPDGRYVAFVQRETDMDANKGRTSLWLLDLTPGSA